MTLNVDSLLPRTLCALETPATQQLAYDMAKPRYPKDALSLYFHAKGEII